MTTTINLSNTQVVEFDHRQCDEPDFVLSGAVVERMEIQILGLYRTRHQSNDIWGQAFQWQRPGRRCLPCGGGVLLGIRDPAMQCKLFDALAYLS